MIETRHTYKITKQMSRLNAIVAVVTEEWHRLLPHKGIYLACMHLHARTDIEML